MAPEKPLAGPPTKFAAGSLSAPAGAARVPPLDPDSFFREKGIEKALRETVFRFAGIRFAM